MVQKGIEQFKEAEFTSPPFFDVKDLALQKLRNEYKWVNI